MHNLWAIVPPAIILALIFYTAAKAVIGTYFGAKEAFVDRIMTKLKGANDGKK